ncbi:hypothetical protein CLOSTMETH_00255 [[Clostridium] methylpentosum DSM 5476]|uniref:Uncharacterized protein n=1 Tax=[Clostridium] methylpentosum DSM 5476 TaxID=537013 RepID=C0E8W0_9FIRM|nr:hypothetical protein CLOSTMETH_00255 [[Clostridium] methylpentosum DSM 5476]
MLTGRAFALLSVGFVSIPNSSLHFCYFPLFLHLSGWLQFQLAYAELFMASILVFRSQL